MNTNGKANGHGAAQTQINPVEAAQFALIFLGRATFTRNERQMFDVAEALLNAIVGGQVQLTSAQQQAPMIDEPVLHTDAIQ